MRCTGSGFRWGTDHEGDGDEHLYHASDYFDQLYEFGENLIRKGKALRRFADRRRDARVPRQLHRSGTRVAVPQPQCRGEPRPVPADEGRRISRRRARAPREDRHGLAQHQHARPGAVPDPARIASPHRRQVVHLSVVRLHALHLRCAGEDHPLDLHARVRGPPAALRLGARRSWPTCCRGTRGNTSSRA
jgi:hypothetical protein